MTPNYKTRLRQIVFLFLKTMIQLHFVQNSFIFIAMSCQRNIPSIRRNGSIAACLDIANLMERGGIGFQTMVESYRDCEVEKQPGILIYPGFLDLI